MKLVRWPLASQICGRAEDGGVDEHDVVALLHHRPDPRVLDVAQHQRAERPVVVGAAEPAVDLRRRVHEAAALAQVDDLVEVRRRHDVPGYGGDPVHQRWDVASAASRSRIAARSARNATWCSHAPTQASDDDGAGRVRGARVGDARGQGIHVAVDPRGRRRRRRPGRSRRRSSSAASSAQLVAGGGERVAGDAQPGRLVDRSTGQLHQAADGDEAGCGLGRHAALAALAEERDERLAGPAVGADRRPPGAHDRRRRSGWPSAPPAQGGHGDGDVAPAGGDRRRSPTSRNVALAPRGQNTTLTTRLTTVPTAMSPRRTSPVLQPCGSSRLKSTTTNTVNDAWPRTKCTADGVYADRKTAIGSSVHRNQSADVMVTSPAAARKPMNVPSRLWNTV